jgi:hypothetical protein
MKMSRIAGVVFIALLLAASTLPAAAGELRVQGKVVNVVPVTASQQVAEPAGNCAPARPDAHAGLATWLAWDLNADCGVRYREEQVVTGYRVTYEWDGHAYSRIMPEPPGATIALRVNLD